MLCLINLFIIILQGQLIADSYSLRRDYYLGSSKGVSPADLVHRIQYCLVGFRAYRLQGTRTPPPEVTFVESRLLVALIFLLNEVELPLRALNVSTLGTRLGLLDFQGKVIVILLFDNIIDSLYFPGLFNQKSSPLAPGQQ